MHHAFFTDQMPNLPDPEHDAQFYEGVPAKRLAAWVVDFLIITVVTLISTAAIGIITLGIGFALFPAIFFLTSFFYRTVTIASSSATWGMALMGLELRTRLGHRLDLPTAAFHTGIFMFLLATGIGAVLTMIAILYTRYNQGIPDLILGTTAINRPID